jgi:glyoxylase-like metal-dependent hydrolase (beta-lactamase superfamily II)
MQPSRGEFTQPVAKASLSRALRIRPVDQSVKRGFHLATPEISWLIEHPEGLILVDTGETPRVADHGYFPWWQPCSVIMTHLHTDHAGGLSHSPKSEVSVVLEEGSQSVFFAGDTSYTQRLMVDQAIDGVAPDEDAARETLHRIRELAHERPLVYLPSHDPEAATRLVARQTVGRNFHLARPGGCAGGGAGRADRQLHQPVQHEAISATGGAARPEGGDGPGAS